MALPANPLPEPDLSDAGRHEVIFNGGMMGGMVMQEMGGSMGDGSSGGMMGNMMGGMGSMMTMMHSGKIWFINGFAAEGHAMDPWRPLRRAASPLPTLTTPTPGPPPPHSPPPPSRLPPPTDPPPPPR